MIYLAGPYSGMEQRSFDALTRHAGLLMERGYNIFSPITHSHPIAQVAELPGCWEYWEHLDREYLTICSAMVVLMLEGWEKSRGVTAEIAIANELGIPVHYHTEGVFEGVAA